MDVFETIRQEAARLHDAVVRLGVDPWKPWDMVCRAALENNCSVETARPGSSNLKGGRGYYDPSTGSIVVERSNPGEEALLAAHEVGHRVVHKPTEPVVTTESDPSRVPEPSSAVAKLVDYGVRERREVQMDLFAREFVLPRKRARELFLRERLSANAIAVRSGLPYAVVAQQIYDAVLLPEMPPAVPKPEVGEKKNANQDGAVIHAGSPYQLQAGPGTGKTRTLIKRIEWLLEKQGVKPENILVLTFSNKAAGELTERLAVRHPEASAVWIGTFHAFGYDILKRFAAEAGLPPKPALIDKVDTVDMLEDALPGLDLKHFRNLHDPTRDIGEFLQAISRAKDEVVGAAKYMEMAKETLANARSFVGKAAEMRERMKDAERTLEAAKVYLVYEELMRARGMLDFGDLVMRPVQLFKERPDVLALAREKHVHILVDEYQDVNRASVLLLKALAGSGEKLWVVGDARQSIYRFRGASSVNMANFKDDFPNGHGTSLDTNYRSHEEVVDTFKMFAADMKASSGGLELSAEKGKCELRPQLREVDREIDEGAAVAAAILELNRAGVAFKDQAVLCRGNKLLATIAEALEERNIPVLYLGSLFEREEIKGLLCLLALLVDPRAASLPRLACNPRYALALPELAAALEAASGATKPMEWPAGLTFSDAGANERLAQLVADLQGFDMSSRPWEVLNGLLLERTDIVRELAASAHARDRVKMIAIWQLLTFCRSVPKLTGAPIAAFLERIRRAVILSEERDLRQMPACTEAMDAVRLSTVHGAKGLEWDAVHIPRLNKKSFPIEGSSTRCYPPDGMITGPDVTGRAAIKRGTREEEECLFFVALSRAKKHLRLYATRQNKNDGDRLRSPFLAEIADYIDEIAPVPLEAPAAADAADYRVDLVLSPDFAVSHDEIEMFGKCALRYLYTRMLKVPGRKLGTPFGRMHDVVYDVIRWLREHPDNFEATSEATQAVFNERWDAIFPTDVVDADRYRRIAQGLVNYLLESRQGTSHLKSEPVLFMYGRPRFARVKLAASFKVCGHVSGL